MERNPCSSINFYYLFKLVHSVGEHEYTYKDLPFTSSVGCMAYHPSEHLLAISAFGLSQPILALDHESGSDLALHTGPSTGTVTRPYSSLGNLDDGTEIMNVDSEPDITQSQLRVSQKWKDLTKTLDRISNKMK